MAALHCPSPPCLPTCLPACLPPPHMWPSLLVGIAITGSHETTPTPPTPHQHSTHRAQCVAHAAHITVCGTLGLSVHTLCCQQSHHITCPLPPPPLSQLGSSLHGLYADLDSLAAAAASVAAAIMSEHTYTLSRPTPAAAAVADAAEAGGGNGEGGGGGGGDAAGLRGPHAAAAHKAGSPPPTPLSEGAVLQQQQQQQAAVPAVEAMAVAGAAAASACDDAVHARHSATATTGTPDAAAPLSGLQPSYTHTATALHGGSGAQLHNVVAVDATGGSQAQGPQPLLGGAGQDSPANSQGVGPAAAVAGHGHATAAAPASRLGEGGRITSGIPAHRRPGAAVAGAAAPAATATADDGGPAGVGAGGAAAVAGARRGVGGGGAGAGAAAWGAEAAARRRLFAAGVMRRVVAKLEGRDESSGVEAARGVAAAVASSRGLSPPVLTVSAQVDHLIRQASSGEKLCQMYEGWMPWI